MTPEYAEHNPHLNQTCMVRPGPTYRRRTYCGRAVRKLEPAQRGELCPACFAALKRSLPPIGGGKPATPTGNRHIESAAGQKELF